MPKKKPQASGASFAVGLFIAVVAYFYIQRTDSSDAAITKENKEKGDTSIPTDTIPSAPADSIPANSTPGAPLQPELTPDGNTLIFRTKDKH